MVPSDYELIDRILAGDEQAVNLLINRHKSYAFTLALKVLNSREEAEEAAHDAFLKALKSLKSFNRTSKFTTWFYRIVFNTAVSRHRKKRIHTEEIGADSEFHPSVESDEFQKKEQQHYLQLAFSQLKDDDQLMLSHFYLKERSLDEMEDILGIPANTLKVKVHRARKRLATVMQQILKEEVHSLI